MSGFRLLWSSGGYRRLLIKMWVGGLRAASQGRTDLNRVSGQFRLEGFGFGV